MEVFVSTQRNNSGFQLSDSNWLENHHNAKKDLRYDFAKNLALRNPKSIVDIGCGTGLWLSTFNELLPKDCNFIGIDLDEDSLAKAKSKSKNWDRKCEWIKLDINKEPEKIPAADLTLIFNFSSYIENLDFVFETLSKERGFKEIALRQFAGDEIKFGPFSPEIQTLINNSVKNSIGASRQIRYYDMDRLIDSTSNSQRKIIYQDFELYKAFSPFGSHNFPYIKGTVNWTLDRVSENEKPVILDWLDMANCDEKLLYFFSLDWVALLQ